MSIRDRLAAHSTSIWFVVVHKETLTPIRAFLTVKDAAQYCNGLEALQIERAYLDYAPQTPKKIHITFLDRPSARTVIEALTSKKVQRARLLITTEEEVTKRKIKLNYMSDKRLNSHIKTILEISDEPRLPVASSGRIR